MTAAELKARLLRVVSVDNVAGAPSHLVDAVVHAVNHAYQVLWQDVPKERRSVYTRRLDTVTLAAGENTHQFNNDVQAILPPVRLLPTLVALLAATHRSEIESYGLRRGRVTGDTTNAPPQAYYIESRHQSEADSLRVSLIVAPTPADETELKVEVELQAPSLTSADLCTLTPAALRIPNDYAESLLYPIAAYHLATQSSWFKRAEMLPSIKEEYERAKARLGIIDPSPAAPALAVKPKTDDDL